MPFPKKNKLLLVLLHQNNNHLLQSLCAPWITVWVTRTDRRERDGCVAMCKVHPRHSGNGLQWSVVDGKRLFSERRVRKPKLKEPYVYISVPQRDKRELTEIVQEYIRRSNIIKGATFLDPRRIGSLKDTALYSF